MSIVLRLRDERKNILKACQKIMFKGNKSEWESFKNVIQSYISYSEKLTPFKSHAELDFFNILKIY